MLKKAFHTSIVTRSIRRTYILRAGPEGGVGPLATRGRVRSGQNSLSQIRGLAQRHGREGDPSYKNVHVGAF